MMKPTILFFALGMFCFVPFFNSDAQQHKKRKPTQQKANSTQQIDKKQEKIGTGSTSLVSDQISGKWIITIDGMNFSPTLNLKIDGDNVINESEFNVEQINWKDGKLTFTHTNRSNGKVIFSATLENGELIGDIILASDGKILRKWKAQRVSNQRNEVMTESQEAGKTQEQAKQRIASQQQSKRSAIKLFSLAVGNQWTYQLHIPKGAMQIYDPYFIEPSGLLESSATHGQTRPEQNPIDATFTIKSTELVSDSSAKVDLGIEKRALWFAVKSKETHMVFSQRLDNLVTLELHATMEMKSGSNWIIGQELAAFPLKGKTNITIGDKTYFAEPLTTLIKVPAGTFSRGSHSIIWKKGTDESFLAPGRNPIPSYRIESWLAQGVGLIKSTMFDSKGNMIYSLELASYQVK